jgi:hypothetical protein
MVKTVTIHQNAGLGDIFFCQKIAETFIYNGYEVYWPVKSTINWVGEYLVNTNKVHYINEDNFTPLDNTYDVVLDGAQNITGNLIMPSKYQILDIDWSDWVDHFNFKRNINKENELYYNVLKLKDNEKYTFINKYYATPPNHQVYNIQEDINEKTINLEMIEGFTIFDWCKVIENASKISIIDTSILFIIDKIFCNSKYFYCYTRNGIFTYNELKDIFQTPWIWLDSNNNKLN